MTIIIAGTIQTIRTHEDPKRVDISIPKDIWVRHEEGGDKETEWFNCRIFGNRAEWAQTNLRKGSQVQVTLEPSYYLNGEGHRQVSYTVLALDPINNFGKSS